MRLKPWQITAVRQALGVYSDRKTPPSDVVTFSHSVKVAPENLMADPIILIEQITEHLNRILTAKHNEIELILDSSSRSAWIKMRSFLEGKKNDKAK